MNRARTAPPEIRTLADLLERLDSIPPGRIRFDPPPGTATEDDLIAIQCRKEGLFELVDGCIVEKAVGCAEATVTSHLITSVGQFGARYFDAIARPGSKPAHGLVVIPLADALTLPVCGLPADVVVVPAFHGGLLGDPSVLPMVSAFLDGRPVHGQDQGRLKAAAEVITGAATAWRMPDTRAACPG